MQVAFKMVGDNDKYEAKYSMSGGTAAQGAAINFQVTEVPAGGSLPITRTFVMVPLAGVAFELECLL